ncbi:MAG: purine nucleoside permease [Opitutales bacterium]
MKQPVRIVLVTYYDPGGDLPGEFTLYRERLGFRRVTEGPKLHFPVYENDDGVLAIVTGPSGLATGHAVSALGWCQHWDLSQAYWILSGVAGANPNVVSLGSAVWHDWLVDAEICYEIDSQEIPAGWPYGTFPMGMRGPVDASVPVAAPAASFREYAYQTPASLLRWAYKLTKDLPLDDPADLQEFRSRFIEQPVALEPPKIAIGTNLSASRYWHGPILNRWAEDWVAHFTQGQSAFATSAMEDFPAIRVVSDLTAAGLADATRFLSLRCASNFTLPAPGVDILTSLCGPEGTVGEPDFPSLKPCLENGYRAVSTVIQALLADWSAYAQAPPKA